MSSASSPLLDFRDVSRSFTVRQGVLGRVRGEVRAVDGVSLSVRRGETLGLVGESGCGKSTLARMAVRLLPPSIAEPLMAIGAPSAERQERVGEILRRVGLQPGHAGRYPHEFSGGQRQRVAIARALVTRPELVVCDEAVSALDASVQAQELNLLKEVQADFGLTYFFISHDLSVVGYMSDRVAVMYLGRIVEQADRNTLFGSAAHPYTKALLAAAPVHDPAKMHIRAFLPGELPSPFSPPAGCAFHPRCPQVMPRCREEAPELREIAPDHLARCHLYG